LWTYRSVSSLAGKSTAQVRHYGEYVCLPALDLGSENGIVNVCRFVRSSPRLPVNPLTLADRNGAEELCIPKIKHCVALRR
jgi:hypothetical protein